MSQLPFNEKTSIKHINPSGNKTKFYNNIAKSILPNKEANAIKANKSISIIDEEETEIKKEGHKKQKSKNNVEVISMAMVEMSQSREKIWKQKMVYKKEKLEKNHELEREQIEAEKERWVH
ncbi:hypothetical protein C1646_672237 [Rhizophagus diaphanus]|nr:hypothetical protein C1646_672237 [Rhizophagus diaphanus] [Rhizophagus sp. MUCL 43196]